MTSKYILKLFAMTFLENENKTIQKGSKNAVDSGYVKQVVTMLRSWERRSPARKIRITKLRITRLNHVSLAINKTT